MYKKQLHLLDKIDLYINKELMMKISKIIKVKVITNQAFKKLISMSQLKLKKEEIQEWLKKIRTKMINLINQVNITKITNIEILKA